MNIVTSEHVKSLVRCYETIALSENDRMMLKDVILHVAREVSQVQAVINRLSPEAIALIDDEIRKNGVPR